MRRKPLIAVLVLLGVHLSPASASADVCGTPDPGGDGPLKGTLTLDEAASTLTQEFERGGGTRQLQIVFDVANCELQREPDIATGPLEDLGEEVPRNALRKPRVRALGEEVKITYSADAAELDPGTYGSLVEVSHIGTLEPARAPVTLSRSEPRILVPGAIGFVAGGLGFALIVFTQNVAGHKLGLSLQKRLLVILCACAAGTAAAILHWFDQDVWVWQENWKVAATTAFGQSTAGVVAAVLIGGFIADPNRGDGKRRFEGPAEDKPEFWHDVFDSFPPAFIKRVEIGRDGKARGESPHVADNQAFSSFQGPNVAGERKDEERTLITGDHRRGDELAVLNERSCQIEASDTYGMHSSSQIVTFKRRIEYEGQTYIVGWYVPVEMTDAMDDTSEVWVRELGQMPVFRLVPATGSGARTKIMVGDASRRAAAAD
jgi:hypothetical protein